MSKYSLATQSLSSECSALLKQLGDRIRFARKRRSMSMHELAARMMAAPKTVQRLEHGDPGIGLGMLLTALMCLGLEKDLGRVAAMETDVIAMAHDRRRLMGKKKKRSDETPEEIFFNE